MKTTCLRAALLLAMVSVYGCSGSDESQVSEVPTGDTLAAASINPQAAVAAGSAAALASAATAGSQDATSGTSDTVEPFRNPFAPPKDPPPPPIVEQPDPEPEAAAPEPAAEVRQPGVPPKIRLLGFLNVGEPKVLVSYREELESLAIGDVLEDMKVVKIDSPELTMLFEENEIKFSLFDQSWRHEGGAASVGKGKGGQTRARSTRPARSTAASTEPTAGERTREPSGIPGFAPNAGKPPGFQPPASPRTGSTPGAPIASPPPGLPGLSGEASGGAGIDDGGVPGIPGLDTGAGGQPGAGIFPKLPGGL